MSLHAMAAAILKAQEFELSQEEAARIATAMARVSRHYPVLDKINDKAIDHFNLFSVLTGVYGTRFFAWKVRTASDKAKPAPSNVTGFRDHTRT